MVYSGRYLPIIITTWLVTILCCVCQGQSFHFSFHHLSPNEGLSQGSNAFIYQDSKGFIWLSSTDGLNRFDGKSVKIYKPTPSNGMLGNIVTSNFFEDEATNLWFTTYEGVHCYVRKQDRFEHFQLKNRQGQKIVEDYYAFHLDIHQKLWVRTGLGEQGYLHLFDIKTQQDSLLCPIDGRRNYPILNKNGEVIQLVSTNFYEKMGIEVVDLQQHFEKSTFFAATGQALPVESFFVACVERDTQWWLGAGDGLVAFNPHQKTAITYATYQNRPIGEVEAVTLFQDSLLILATSKEGVLLFDKRRRAFVQHIPQELDNPLGLSLKSVAAFYVDKQENLWVSSPRGGVNFTNLRKQKFEQKELLRGSVSGVIFQAKDGAIWCNGVAGKAIRFNADGSLGKLFELERPDAIPAKNVQYFFEDEAGELWACCDRFLFKWNTKNQRFYYVQQLPNSILYVYKLPNETILMSTFSGVYTFQANQETDRFTKPQDLADFQNTTPTAFYEDKKGRLYLALDATRLAILEKKNGSYKEQKMIEKIGYANAFYETGDTIWVATTSGILKIDTKDFTYVKLNEKEHNAPIENYYSILPDASGNFWLSCNRGIIRYHPIKKMCRRYTLMDGLQDNEFNTNAYLLNKKGEIWMGGNRGLNVFQPAYIKDVPYTPGVQLTQLMINDEPYDTKVQVGELKELTLPYLKNTISLDFVALEYSDPENNVFQYQLENYDKDWVSAGTNGFVRYANLPSGYYIFKVKAANSDGVWNETPTELRIFIRTPWWRTWWFYLLCVIIITGIAYSIFIYRLRQALKIERMRVKISSDLHDDVGTILSGLAMQSEILELTASQKTKPKLQRISELSRSAMSHMRDTVWAIDARKDKLENLLDRMREHAEETLTPKNILFDLQIDQLALTKNMPSHIRQNLYLLYKEAITNIAKHSNATKVTIQLQKIGNHGLEMRIHDNGEFKQKDYKTTGSGLANMRMRAEQIGGTFDIDTSNGFLITIQLQRLS